MRQSRRFPLCLAIASLALAPSSLAREPRPERTFLVSMRDGVRLATDVYLPSPDASGLPCVLIRTPYDRKRYNVEFGSIARQGYAVAVQDMRGRFDSEGKAMAFQDDGWGALRDGHDTVRWLARQPFSNGRVGTLGASAMGIAQYLMAPTQPPELECQYVLVAAPSLYHHAAYTGGVLREKMTVDWLEANAHPDALRRTLDHRLYDEYWRSFDMLRHAEKVRVPILHYGGWYDIFSQGTIDAFVALQRRGGKGARGRQKLVMGPWTHGGQGKSEFGDFNLPKAARRTPVDVSARRWFEHYLRGDENGIDRMAPVIYYVMGPFDRPSTAGNFWRSADAWPPPSEPTSWYLRPDGLLARQRSVGESRVFRFDHDPRDPVPTVGGANLFLEAGPKDQRGIEAREDVVVFTSEPLSRDVGVTGRVAAVVHFATRARDTDVVVRFCDVYPDGRSILIADGIRRLSSVVPQQGARDLKAPREVELDLWSTSIILARGHRLRVSISSSNAPRYEVNTGTGLPAYASPERQVQRNSLHVGGEYPSRVVLPVAR